MDQQRSWSMIYRYEFLRFASHPRYNEVADSGSLHAPNFEIAKSHAKSLLKSVVMSADQGPRPDGIRLFDGQGSEIWTWCE